MTTLSIKLKYYKEEVSINFYILLDKLNSLQNLSLSLFKLKTEQFEFFIKKFINPFYVPIEKQKTKLTNFVPLKTLSLSFESFEQNALVLQQINENKTLKHFSIRGNYFKLKPPYFQNDSNLKVLKLINIDFSPSKAEKFFNFFRLNNTLESLHVSESIINSLNSFLSALSANSSLKDLALICEKNSNDCMEAEDFVSIMNCITNTQIEEFSIFFLLYQNEFSFTEYVNSNVILQEIKEK